MNSKSQSQLYLWTIVLGTLVLLITILSRFNTPSIEKDYCPDGDFSLSYYDGACKNTNGTPTGEVVQSNEYMIKYFNHLNQGNLIKLTFPNQPGHDGYNYQTDSQILNSYLQNNNKKFSLPNDTKAGYLYIKTRKPTNSIFIYWHLSDNGAGYPVSGKLTTEKSLFTGSSTEFLYKLDEVWVNYYFDGKSRPYNWLQDILQEGETYIGGYIASFDGNKIEEIIVTYE